MSPTKTAQKNSSAAAAAAAPAGGLVARVITLALPLLLGILLAAPSWAWLILVGLATGIALVEFYAITLGPEDTATQAMGVAMGTLLIPTLGFGHNGLVLVCGLMTVVLVMFVTGLFAYSSLEKAGRVITAGVTGVFYVAFLLGCLLFLRQDPRGGEGRYWVLMVLAITWAGDTGAYFAGRFLGRHKLAPEVSPKKTWEGAIGGVLASVGAAFAVVAVTDLRLSPLMVVMLAVPAAIIGQLGDLCESLLKRAYGVKDSGRIIYGHGGILDRIDGVIFTAPYVYFFYCLTALGPSTLR
jgi:phosphatidate cytidylyltransferase